MVTIQSVRILVKKGRISVILRLFLQPMLGHRLQKVGSADEKPSSFLTQNHLAV
jgi:hypothetical protein